MLAARGGARRMLRDWSRRRGFSVLVFVAAAVVIESGILLRAYVARSADVPVQRGASSQESGDGFVSSTAVDEFMVANLRATGIPGAVVAITRDERILHVAAYGYAADGAVVTPATPLPVASLTKSFTSAAVMRLAEQGKIRLDALVQQYLPEFELADPRAAHITVAHLLSQTSGLANRGLPPRRPEVPRTLAAQLEWLRGAVLVSAPGTQYNYCNENYDVLASLIERVRGLPFDRAMESELFAPLGMRSSRLFVTLGESLPGVAAGHTLTFGFPIAREIPAGMGSGGGGAVSSADDLARWLVFQSTGGVTVAGEQVLSEASVAAMHTPSFAQSDYAFGWSRAVLPDGAAYVHHSGRFPNFAAHQRLFPQSGYAFAFVLNGMHPFNAEAASFIAGLTAIVEGDVPTIGPPYLVFGLPWGVIADGAMAVLILLFASIGAFGTVRSRAWAARYGSSPPWVIALRLLPYFLMSVVVAASPWLMSTVNRGQPVPLGLIFSQWPPLGIVFVAAMVAGSAVVTFRFARLLQIGGAARGFRAPAQRSNT